MKTVLDRFDGIRSEDALARLAGVVERTPLAPFSGADPRVALRLKLECLQVTGAFKARGAWNSIARLGSEERKAGVVATSSGNHGRALAWAARRASVPATIYMPADAYPNKIQACRDAGAEVVLLDTREAAEEACAAHVARGATWVPPYDADATIEGAGTVGWEIAEQWPEVEVVVVPVGGGGLIAGSALSLRRRLGDGVKILGAEPEGAPTLLRGLEAGQPVVLQEITTRVQGLCPLSIGHRNLALCLELVQGSITLDDATIFAAQAELVRRGGWVVEPAGAAAAAAVLSGRLPAEWLTGRSPEDPLRVVAVVSGGNPDPAQLAAIRSDSPASDSS